MATTHDSSESDFTLPLSDPSQYHDGLPSPERDQLNAYHLIDMVGDRVIRIDRVNYGLQHYGTLEGEIVPTDDEQTLCVCSSEDGVVHRFVHLSDFHWRQGQFFIASNWFRRRRYLTDEARRWRSQTYALFAKAVGKGIILTGDIDRCREMGTEMLEEYLKVRLNVPYLAPEGEVLRRLNDL